jgi:polyketide biosynthesis enoyl-CoA hydratase PksH
VDLGPSAPVREFSLDRGDEQNSIDDKLVDQLNAALDAAEADRQCRILLLTSAPGVFSTGMNLTAAGRSDGDPGARAEQAGGAFFDLLNRFTATPVVVVSAVDGRVAGGGVGLVAASDLVYATERSTFALPEALWGLLPCCVLPFLVRRVGFQRAYTMMLTTTPVTAAVAAGRGLVDEVAGDLTPMVRRLSSRVGKLDPVTIGDLKRYGRSLWPIDGDTRRLAVSELSRLMAQPAVQDRLTAFAEHGRFPWESR